MYEQLQQVSPPQEVKKVYPHFTFYALMFIFAGIFLFIASGFIIEKNDFLFGATAFLGIVIVFSSIISLIRYKTKDNFDWTFSVGTFVITMGLAGLTFGIIYTLLVLPMIGYTGGSPSWEGLLLASTLPILLPLLFTIGSIGMVRKKAWAKILTILSLVSWCIIYFIIFS